MSQYGGGLDVLGRIMNVVPSIVLKGIEELIDSYGAEHKDLLLAAGFDPGLLSRPDNLIDGQQFCDLLEFCASELNQRFFGILLAGIQGASIIGPLWFILQNSNTIGDAVQQLVKNFPAHTEATYWYIQKIDSGIILCYDVNPAIKGEVEQAVELGMAMVCDGLRSHLGEAWEPVSSYFKYSAPVSTKFMVNIFGKGIKFDQEFNGIVITREELDATIAGASFLSKNLYQHEFLSRSEFSSKSIVVQTENVISTNLARCSCSLNFVAKCLDINPRTLRYQLKNQGTSFQKILTKAKINLALVYLTQSRLKVAEIAERLHFSEAAAFSRFIKRHTGKSPKEHQIDR